MRSWIIDDEIFKLIFRVKCVYLQESEKALLVFSVHIATFKKLEIWHEPISRADVPAEREETP